jgi:UDP-N-acetylglucosamine--N-acetylmuramyl-(pentapeptide) pyrophosphoryl-undecaprenol N-acetylglucosamine transferase
MGLANKTTARFCNKILTTFPETTKKIKNSYHVGPPLRKSLFNQDKSYAKKYFNIKSNKPILLITGGSQGAKSINDCIRKDLDNLLKHFEIIHLCGKNNLDTSVKNNQYHQIEYLDRIELAYSIADVCVTRGGSNTLFELIALKIPCLIIPLPKGNSRGDQIVNAQYFCNKHMANVLYQENISPSSLRKKILQTYNNKEFYTKNIEKNKIKDGCPLIYKIILENVK